MNGKGGMKELMEGFQCEARRNDVPFASAKGHIHMYVQQAGEEPELLQLLSGCPW